MMHSKITFNIKTKALLFAALFLLLVNVSGVWASSWNVSLTLKRDTIEDAMVMPTAVFVDKEGEKYYVVDSGKNRVLSFDRAGNLLHVFTAGNTLEVPFDMVRLDDGVLWVVEKGKNTLTQIDLQAKKTIPETLISRGVKVFPHRIETDGSLLYVQDKSTGDIIVYDNKLVEKNRIECDSCLQGFFDFKLKGETIWALDRLGKAIYAYSTSGKQNKKIQLGKEVVYPSSIAVGPSGYIFVLDRQSKDIAAYDPEGVYKYRFLQPGISSGQLYYPVEITFDPWDNLCVTDEGNARVEVYTR